MARLPGLLVALALSLATVCAPAQTGWPTKPVRIVVPYPPGGTADIITRIAVEELTKDMSKNNLDIIGEVS